MTIFKCALILIVCLATSCGYQSPEEFLQDSMNGPGGGDRNTFGGNTPDWQTVSTRVFTPFCIRCHNEFTSYSTTAQKAGAIRNVIQRGVMPPSSPLSLELQDLVLNWINSGAPETTIPGTDPGGPPPSPPPPDEGCDDDDDDDDDRRPNDLRLLSIKKPCRQP